MKAVGTSLVVQCLRLHASNAGAQVLLVGELRSYMPHDTTHPLKKAVSIKCLEET